MTSLTGLQLRAARALLKWRAQDLARKSRVGKDIIQRGELLDGEVNMTDAQKQAIIKVFDLAGVTLISAQDIGIGAAFLKKANVPGLIG